MGQIYQGIHFMLIGMVSVFVFLSVLVFATTLLSRLIQSIERRSAKAFASSNKTRQDRLDPQVIAAISASITQFRNRH